MLRSLKVFFLIKKLKKRIENTLAAIEGALVELGWQKHAVKTVLPRAAGGAEPNGRES